MKRAKAIWLSHRESENNQFVGFHTFLRTEKEKKAIVRIAARSYYRLFLNGEMISCGPARTAETYCRMDEIEVILPPKSDLAIEVAAYNKPEKYCNDCTMEPGMLAAEVEDEAGNILTFTGEEGWTCEELTCRRSRVETMSHCRGIVEYYDLTEDSFSWRQRELARQPEILKEESTYLKRRAPYATYRRIEMQSLQMLYDVKTSGEPKKMPSTFLAKAVNPKWYGQIPEENLFLEGLENEVDEPFSGTFDTTRGRKTGKKCLRICPGEAPAAAVWELPHSEVGFLELYLTVEEDCVMDVLNTDALSEKGHVEGNTYAARYVLKAGKYHLISFEPRLIRYVKCIFRTRGKVEIACPAVLEDTYPDDHTAYFSCDDGDLNRIYEASRRTLRLNMLDLFMDCPQRERGGWLCDSYFSARGAWQMFGDLRVEKDFLENFLLTDADHMWQGFFPEVYPGVRGKGEIRDVGIRNWSFWLMLELCDYCDRSGDGQFAQKHRGRVDRFVEGLLALRGEHGLLEKDAGPFFVDWSLANQPFALEPVSIPINCLAVFMLKRLAGLYQKEEWSQAAEKMEEAVSRLTQEKAFGQSGCETEGGVALELWSGFHGDDREYIRRFVDSMGSCPKYRPDPNIGKANLFIGLMLRFDVLARMGRADVLVREWKDLYLEELQNGAGTLFESIQERSGCHGFNGYVGALMTNQILGLGIPMQSTKTVMISPHPGELNWACGNAVCEEGNIYFKWSADHENHIFDMTLYLPKGWEARYELPFELSGWSIRLNGKVFQES